MDRLKLGIRIFQVATILVLGGIFLLSGIMTYRAGMVRGKPVSIPDEERRIAAAEARLAGSEEANRRPGGPEKPAPGGASDDSPEHLRAQCEAYEEIRSAKERIHEERRRQEAAASRGRAVLTIAVGLVAYAALVFEFVRLVILRRRRVPPACAGGGDPAGTRN